MKATALLLLLTTASPPALPSRIRRVVLHVLGHPSYDRPELRFVFFTPEKTMSLWRPHFGAHWIVWTDGSIWSRHARRGMPSFFFPLPDPDEDLCRRVALEAAPVYAHAVGCNSDSVGIEVAHSGRTEDPFPEAQVDSLAWLLETLRALSGGRLDAGSIVGHKDVEHRLAYAGCEKAGCPVFVDREGVPFPRRVDPPESLFLALEKRGLRIPRKENGDADLLRAETLAPGLRAETRP